MAGRNPTLAGTHPSKTMVRTQWRWSTPCEWSGEPPGLPLTPPGRSYCRALKNFPQRVKPPPIGVRVARISINQ